MNPSVFIIPLSLILPVLHFFFRRPPKDGWTLVDLLLFYQLILVVGVNSLFAFYGHAFLSDEIARYIGWPTGNPFQLEVAATNLTFGILGVLCMWIRGHFWTATLLGISIWYLGDAYVHLRDLSLHGNTAPGNAGVPLYMDIILPLFWLTLLGLHLWKGKRRETI
jgi:hypothetical protein